MSRPTATLKTAGSPWLLTIGEREHDCSNLADVQEVLNREGLCPLDVQLTLADAMRVALTKYGRSGYSYQPSAAGRKNGRNKR